MYQGISFGILNTSGPYTSGEVECLLRRRLSLERERELEDERLERAGWCETGERDLRLLLYCFGG